MAAIVASGYLFADELAYHVDVYQGDTPTSLLERHAPGATVKTAAVIDIDIPGSTEPLPLEADEPVVVVGNSPRTSVFVYGETRDSNQVQEEKKNDLGAQLPKTSDHEKTKNAELTTLKRVEEPQSEEAVAQEDDAVEMEVEDLVPSPDSADPTSSEDINAPTSPLAESAERPFSRTRRAPKSKANRHTRRIPHVPRSLKIELA